MLKLAVLTIEDESGKEIYDALVKNLDEWVFVRKGLVQLYRPDDPADGCVSNLEDARCRMDWLADGHDLVFCTVDLAIPSTSETEVPDPRNGFSIVHEISNRRSDGLRCCVLTGMSSDEVKNLLDEGEPDVLFDFKVDAEEAIRNISNNIRSEALALLDSLEFEFGGQPRRVLLTEESGRLRDHYLSRATYFIDRPTWHVPTLVLGERGMGRRTLAEFIAFLGDAELIEVDLAKGDAANRKNYLKLESLAIEMEETAQGRNHPRYLSYIANLDSYDPETGSENCLVPLRRILERVAQLGSTQPEGFSHGLIFSASGQSRLQIRSHQTRSFVRYLEECIGATTDFPLHHLATGIHGWTADHPRTLALPSIRECGRDFLHEVTLIYLESLRARMAESYPAYRGEALTLSRPVEDFLIDKLDWFQHENLRGLVGALDEAFERFQDDRAVDQYEITRAHLGKRLRAILGRTLINADEVTLTFGKDSGTRLEVVERADFHVENGELLALVGPSGCGKSSILRILAGLLDPTSGSVTFRGEEVQGPSHHIGFIFQDYSLFPWLNVRQNIEFGPRVRGESVAAAAVRINALLEVAELKGFEASYPNELSGGMQQRVAIIRSLANEPDVLLMDEPFGALDVQTRWRMQDFLVRTKELTKKTIVFVTHDIDEAVFIGDRVYVATPRPMTISDEFIIPFSAGVRTENLRTQPVFVALVNRVRAALLQDIRASAAQTSLHR